MRVTATQTQSVMAASYVNGIVVRSPMISLNNSMKGPLVANNLRGRTYLVHNKAYYKISWFVMKNIYRWCQRCRKVCNVQKYWQILALFEIFLRIKILNQKVSYNASFTFSTLILNVGAFECSMYACLYASRTFRKCFLFAFLCKKTKEFFENHFIMEELRFVIFSKTFW